METIIRSGGCKGKLKYKDEINGNFDVLIETKNTTESSRLFSCTKIKYYFNHIMIFNKKDLIFKVWLRRDKYDGLKEAMQDVGMRLYIFDFKNGKKI